MLYVRIGFSFIALLFILLLAIGDRELLSTGIKFSSLMYFSIGSFIALHKLEKNVLIVIAKPICVFALLCLLISIMFGKGFGIIPSGANHVCIGVLLMTVASVTSKVDWRPFPRVLSGCGLVIMGLHPIMITLIHKLGIGCSGLHYYGTWMLATCMSLGVAVAVNLITPSFFFILCGGRNGKKN